MTGPVLMSCWYPVFHLVLLLCCKLCSLFPPCFFPVLSYPFEHTSHATWDLPAPSVILMFLWLGRSSFGSQPQLPSETNFNHSYSLEHLRALSCSESLACQPKAKFSKIRGCNERFRSKEGLDPHPTPPVDPFSSRETESRTPLASCQAWGTTRAVFKEWWLLLPICSRSGPSDQCDCTRRAVS